ncbi:MAG: hypothetical protein Q8M16_13405 [Pirellulaceae bacterium]|nr:hypothetical protein [Pirellulaceae bacterium]
MNFKTKFVEALTTIKVTANINVPLEIIKSRCHATIWRAQSKNKQFRSKQFQLSIPAEKPTNVQRYRVIQHEAVVA